MTKEQMQEKVDFIIEAILEIVAPLVSILALAIPAISTFISTGLYLEYGLFRQVAAALVVEFTGLSAITDSMKYWKHNRDYSYTNREGKTTTSKKRKAPFGVAVGVVVLYFFLLIALNVALEFTTTNALLDTILKTSAKITLILIAIPNVLLLGARYQYKQILSEINQPKQKPVETLVKDKETVKKVSENFPKDFRHLTNKHKDRLKGLSPLEIKDLVGVTERTGLTWSKRLNSNGHKKEEIIV